MSYLNPNDPAILLYPKDVLAESRLLDNEDIGKLTVFRCLFAIHGRLTATQVKRAIGELSDSLKQIIQVDGNDKYYCPETEKIIIARRDYSLTKSNDGIKGNKGKKVKKERGVSTEKAREILKEEEGMVFGKDKYCTPGDTPSEHNKVNAIGSKDYYSLTKEDEEEVLSIKQEEEEVQRIIDKQAYQSLTENENSLLIKHGLTPGQLTKGATMGVTKLSG